MGFCYGFLMGKIRLVRLWLDFGFRMVGLWILNSDWLVWWWCGGGDYGGWLREREREIEIRERSEIIFILFLFYFMLF